MHLLERDQQLATLHAYADDARGGDGRLVLVSGEAGIGKSSLVEAFVEGLDPGDDTRVAWSACDGAFTPSALGPLQDVADQWGGAVRVACAEGVPRDTRFAALLAELREHGEQGVCRCSSWRTCTSPTRRPSTWSATRPPAARGPGAGRGDVPRRRPGREPRPARDPGRASDAALHPPDRPAAPDRGAVVALSDGDGPRAGCRPRAHRRQPVLRQRGAPRASRASCPPPPATRSSPGPRGSRAAGRDVLDAAALIGERVEPDLLRVVTAADTAALDEPIAAGLLVADGDGAAVPPRDRPAGRRAGGRAAHRRRGAPPHPRALRRSGIATTPAWPTTPRARSTRPPSCATPAGRATGPRQLASRREAVAQYRRALRFVPADQPLRRGPSCSTGSATSWPRSTTVAGRRLRRSRSRSALWRRRGDAVARGRRAAAAQLRLLATVPRPGGAWRPPTPPSPSSTRSGRQPRAGVRPGASRRAAR